jgi:hypothetical protein
MPDNKSRQPLLLFHQRELYQIAAQSLKKRMAERPHREKLMHEGAEAFYVERENNGIPSCVFLINLDPSYIHNLLITEAETLRPGLIVSVSQGPKPPTVERAGVMVPHHCIRSVGRPELSKRFILGEDLYFNSKLVDSLRTIIPQEDIFSERNTIFSTNLSNVDDSSLDWLYKKDRVLSFDRLSAELLRVSKVLNLPVATVHFVGDSEYTKEKLRHFCENVDLNSQLLF